MDRFNSWRLLDYHHTHVHTDMYDTQDWALTTHWGPAALQKDTRRCSPDFSVSSGPVHLRARQQHRGEILKTVKESKQEESESDGGNEPPTCDTELKEKEVKTFFRHRQLQVLVSDTVGCVVFIKMNFHSLIFH